MKVKIDARTRLMLMRRDPPFCGVLAAMVAGAALGEKNTRCSERGDRETDDRVLKNKDLSTKRLVYKFVPDNTQTLSK